MEGRNTVFSIVLWGTALLVVGVASGAQDVSLVQGVEFFEKKIRPVLAENCYVCHGPKNDAMGGLRLDTKSGILQGGSRGPAVVPGKPSSSLLLKAISYKDPRLTMPPAGKLKKEEIADFIAWVAVGAPIPNPQVQSVPAIEEQKGIDYTEARKFWSFSPVTYHLPPKVQKSDWPTSPTDNFILAKLEEKGLIPAPPTDRRTWLRRVTFDLIGLPPTTEDIEEFLADGSVSAFQKVIDRLLASPHYGERWGRHWLDVVRFAETNGHEYDEEKLDAWRYRDYVIRAFNDDLPYNQFIMEHIAGDLLDEQRTKFNGSQLESSLGTGFYWFGEVLNSAVDSEKAVADQVDNQIDVMSKAFLGLTVACARCHDHKFDPISTADYYSLGGILHSTEIREASLDSADRVREISATNGMIADKTYHINGFLQSVWMPLSKLLTDYMLGAAELISSSTSTIRKSTWCGDVRCSPEEKTEEREKREKAIMKLAEERSLDVVMLRAWVSYLYNAGRDRGHIFYPFSILAQRTNKNVNSPFLDFLAVVRDELQQGSSKEALNLIARKRGDIVFEDFEKSGYEGWRVEGQAFGDRPQRRIYPSQPLRGFRGTGIANSFGGGSDRLVGSITSKKFKMPKLYAHVRMAGSKENFSHHFSNPPGKTEISKTLHKLRFSIISSGYKSQYGMPDGTGDLNWKTVTLTKEIGRDCFFEIVDRSRDGHIAVDKIVFSDSKEPPPFSSPVHPLVLALLKDQDLNSLVDLAVAYQQMFMRVIQEDGTGKAEKRALLAALSPTGKLEDNLGFLGLSQQASIRRLQEDRIALEKNFPTSTFGLVSADDKPLNIQIHIRGNHKNLGKEVPRGTLQVISGGFPKLVSEGSGRLQLARWLANPENPLSARVMVNRIWKHHFGQGLVRSVDNFGRMGELPTHPKLLDFLAHKFVENNWSVKALHRNILLSSTYRMSSKAGKKADSIDPENKLVHHMPVKRLEGEVIRDSILAVSGELNRTLFGPSLTPYISKHQIGRGRPPSGPLDGGGRRSIYIEVRRNFLTPMFLTFDYPLPISTIGKRSLSTVSSQALLLMNNKLVALSARRWAKKLMKFETHTLRRVEKMYTSAFGRLPEEWEVTEVEDFLERQLTYYRGIAELTVGEDIKEQVWADLAHSLFNSVEFIYVR